jgi:hypothetical protein
MPLFDIPELELLPQPRHRINSIVATTVKHRDAVFFIFMRTTGTSLAAVRGSLDSGFSAQWHESVSDLLLDERHYSTSARLLTL